MAVKEIAVGYQHQHKNLFSTIKYIYTNEGIRGNYILYNTYELKIIIKYNILKGYLEGFQYKYQELLSGQVCSL